MSFVIIIGKFVIFTETCRGDIEGDLNANCISNDEFSSRTTIKIIKIINDFFKSNIYFLYDGYKNQTIFYWNPYYYRQ